MTLPEHHLVSAVSLSLPDDLTGEEVCALCAQRGTCCCATDPAFAHLSFPLSLPEWRRLVPYAGLATRNPDEAEPAWAAPAQAVPDAPPQGGDAVSVAEDNCPEFMQAMASLFPRESGRLAGIFPSQGRHFRLRTRADGSCVFLGERGCRLPRNVRPWYCLLFPGWVQGSSVTLFLSESCLVAGQAKNPAHGLKIIGIARSDLLAMHAALRRDWGL